MWFGRAVFLIGGAAMLAVAMNYTAARVIVTRRSPPAAESLDRSPPGAEELRLRSRDGIELGATFWPPPPAPARGRRQQRPAVLVTHGRGASRSARQDQARIFHDAGCPVFLLTLRAHGGSAGDRTSFGWDERHDVRAGLRELSRRAPDRDLILCGSSMGAAAIAFAVSDVAEPPPADLPTPDLLVLECPYGRLSEAMRQRLVLRLPSFAATPAGHLLDFVAPMVLPSYARIAPLEVIEGWANDDSDSTKGPLVRVLQGEDDDRISPADRRAYRALPLTLMVPKAGHDRLLGDAPETYRPFIQSLCLAFSR